MSEALRRARALGVAVEFADLGEWGVDELRSEYDPQGPTIRVNLRIAEHLPSSELGEFISLAVGHELYHHRERTNEVARLENRATREFAANEYARSLLAID